MSSEVILKEHVVDEESAEDVGVEQNDLGVPAICSLGLREVGGHSCNRDVLARRLAIVFRAFETVGGYARSKDWAGIHGARDHQEWDKGKRRKQPRRTNRQRDHSLVPGRQDGWSCIIYTSAPLLPKIVTFWCQERAALSNVPTKDMPLFLPQKMTACSAEIVIPVDPLRKHRRRACAWFLAFLRIPTQYSYLLQ